MPERFTDLLRDIVRPATGAQRLFPPFVGTERFQVLRRLGSGGFGVVYLVHDTSAGAQIALKTLSDARPELIYRLKHEFRALADLRHENLVSFYELFAEDDRVFFTMEYVPGTPFHEHVRRGGDVDERRLRSALAQLVAGLSALHQAGKLHRDVKPANVLVTSAGRVVLLDFGLATDIVEGGLGRTAELAGTPEFMSPEHAAGAPPSAASDWYSVGVVLYQSLTGRLPFAGAWSQLAAGGRRPTPPPPAALVPALPRDLCDLCERLLLEDAEARPNAAEIASVVGAIATSGELPDESSASRAPFVGRADELGLLRGAFERAREGRGVTAIVEGPSGIGKSTLVQQFLSEAEKRDGATVLRGRCYERERVPYQGIDSLMDDLCRLLLALDAHALAGVLPRHLGAVVRLFPVLGRVPVIAASHACATQGDADAQEHRRLGFGAMRELLARIADRRPLVLHIDDLQWGDLDTAALLREILRPPDAPPMLLIVTYRAEERERSPCLRALAASQLGEVTRIEVGPLDGGAAEALASALATAARERVDAVRIAAEAGGSPFFIHELVRFASEPAPAGAAPASADLVTALRARIEQLPAAARQLLDVVAVAGHPIAESLARRAAGLDGAAWDAWRLLDQGRLVRFGGPRTARLVEPYHDRIRDVALAALPAARAIACHAGLARALEALHDADPEVLARHHEAGGSRGRARALASAAAEQAEKALAFDRAARLFRWALELTDAGDAARPRLLASLGTALANAGRGIEASRAYQEAAELAPLEARVELRRRAAEQLLFSGRIDEGRELVGEDLRAAGFPIPRTPRRAVASYFAHCALLRVRGLSFSPRPRTEISPRDLALLDHIWAVTRALSIVDPVRSADLAVRLLLAALRCGDVTFVTGATAIVAGMTAVEAPGSRRARFLLARLATLARELGAPWARGYAHMIQGIHAMVSTSFSSAVAASDDATRIFREECTGLVWESWNARLFSEWSLFYLGAWRELRRRHDEHLEEARERGNIAAMALTRVPFGTMALLSRGDVEAAGENAREAIATWTADGFHLQHYWLLLAESFLDLHAGRGDLAWSRVRDRWPALRRSLALRIPFVRMQTVHLRGGCALAAARLERTARGRVALLDETTRAARAVERVRLPLARALGALLRAGVAAVTSDITSATRRLEKAATELERQQVAPYAAAARWHLARLRGDAAPPFLPGEEVVDPASMVRILAPGFEAP